MEQDVLQPPDPTSPLSEQPVVPPPTKSKQPIILAVGIVIVIVIAALLTYFFVTNKPKSSQLPSNTFINLSPTLNPTENWKTHSFSTLDTKLTIKYPPGYVVEDELAGFLLASDKDTLGYPNASASGRIRISSSVSGLASKNKDSNQQGFYDFVQIALNNTYGKRRLVSGDTVIPLRNQNGGTYDGRKYFIDDVSYEKVKINGVNAGLYKVSEDEYVYYIPSKSERSYAIFHVYPGKAASSEIVQNIFKSITIEENPAK